MIEHLAEYRGLFAAAFLSATVLPFQSEVILFGLLLTEHYHWWLLILVASVAMSQERAMVPNPNGIRVASR